MFIYQERQTPAPGGQMIILNHDGLISLPVIGQA